MRYTENTGRIFADHCRNPCAAVAKGARCQTGLSPCRQGMGNDKTGRRLFLVLPGHGRQIAGPGLLSIPIGYRCERYVSGGACTALARTCALMEPYVPRLWHGTKSHFFIIQKEQISNERGRENSLKPFGKTRTQEQPLSAAAQEQLNASVELANLFAHYIKADSLEEARAEMKALVEETEGMEVPQSTGAAPEETRSNAPETPPMQGASAMQGTQPMQGAAAMQQAATRAGDAMAQAYQALEGSMDEEKLDKLMESEAFAALIQSGVPPIMAARCILMDELLAAAEARGEKRGRTQVKNKLGRMNEVGTGMTNAFRTGIDPDKLSLKEIRDLKKRAGRGETITI